MSLSFSRRAAATLLLLGVLQVSGCAVAPAQDLGQRLTDPAKPQRSQMAHRPARVFTAEQPARLMVIGDSLSQGFGQGLSQRAAERGLNLRVLERGRVSSGLARADFYDWPATFESLAASEKPDLVVAHFGANDMQSVTRPGNRGTYGTDSWEPAYRAETRRVIEAALANDAVILWLGPAPDGHANLGRHLQRVAQIFKEEMEASGALYLPLAEDFGGDDGSFVRAIPVNGTNVTIRTGDLSHFNLRGYRLVADRILDDLVRYFPDLSPRTDELAALQ
ncbi:DUF459 domain-containing protein [Pseudooceanicola nanhaiensis]|uniref:SGNH/GDSL hydrolase family protein n=1 Tax=Pseudooceanicola nanhaiensis TaxID=375761 RepID=UPI001CD2FF36|nr:DUF459 domain-containing protein [Pseudooceanicola nanhaiensis]MCA0921172.1 DUF459 domain-containing protein [Pseudooceanicola nanhaiensis]